MITEDYCSFELSKLLKEKGFDWLCRGFYYKGREVAEPYFRSNEGIDNWNEQPLSVRDLWFSAPTHQMAMKWLREVHKIWFLIYRDFIKGKWDYAVHHYNYGQEFNHGVIIYYNSYEEAVEAALKYVLENLI